MKNSTFLFIFLCILTSCMTSENMIRFSEEEILLAGVENSDNFRKTANNPVVIDMNSVLEAGRIEENNLYEAIELIPLQTNKESVFQGIIQLEMSNDRFFIKDENSDVFIFRTDGCFVKKLTRGQGPGEVYRVGSIAWDNSNQNFIVCQNDILNFYDKDGNYIRQKKCPFMFMEFYTIKNGYLFFHDRFVNKHLGDDANCAVFVSDDNFKIQAKGIAAIPSNYNYVKTMKMILPENGKYLVSQFFNDTIFEINPNSNSLAVKYILDYREKKVTLDDFNAQINNDKFYNMSIVYENSRSQLFQFWSRKFGLCFVLRDRTTGKMIGGTELFVDETIVPECLFHTRNIHNDYFVSYTDAYKGMHFSSMVVDAASNERVSDLDEESNPVIILYKLNHIK